MAKEQEHTTIGVNKPTMLMIVLVLSVIAGAAFWKDRGGTEAKADTTHAFVVESNTGRITETEKGLAIVRTDLTTFKEDTKERFSTAELTQLSIQKDQQALLKGQEAIQRQRTEDNKLWREQRKEDAKLLRDQRAEDIKYRADQQKTISELNAYLRTIEKIE